MCMNNAAPEGTDKLPNDRIVADKNGVITVVQAKPSVPTNQ